MQICRVKKGPAVKRGPVKRGPVKRGPVAAPTPPPSPLHAAWPLVANWHVGDDIVRGNQRQSACTLTGSEPNRASASISNTRAKLIGVTLESAPAISSALTTSSWPYLMREAIRGPSEGRLAVPHEGGNQRAIRRALRGASEGIQILDEIDEIVIGRTRWPRATACNHRAPAWCASRAISCA